MSERTCLHSDPVRWTIRKSFNSTIFGPVFQHELILQALIFTIQEMYIHIEKRKENGNRLLRDGLVDRWRKKTTKNSTRPGAKKAKKKPNNTQIKNQEPNANSAVEAHDM